MINIIFIMKMNEDLVSIHAYLCADGYVIRNPSTQKQKYYKIGLRNTNSVLLNDFRDKFERVFGVKPHIRIGERCEIGSKKIYEELINEYGSFHSHLWKIPNFKNRKLYGIWLRSFFDCEGWVFCKSKQNRHIGLDCVNENGINQIIESLNSFGIRTIKKKNEKRKIFRIFIYGKDNLIKFSDKIGFLHPDKNIKLDKTLNDFVTYIWNFPKEEEECKKFVFSKLKDRIKIKKPHYARIISREENNLKKLKMLIKKFYDIESILYNSVNGIGTKYFELDINRKEDIMKLIKLKIIPNILKNA